MGSKLVYRKSLTAKIQSSIEREVDFIYEVKLEDGSNFLLHLEFQSNNDTNMIFRVAEYHGLLFKNSNCLYDILLSTLEKNHRL